MVTKTLNLAGFPYGQPGMYRGDSFDTSARSVIDPSTGLVQTQSLIPSTSNTYGALGIGISANGTKGDGTGEKKKKASLGFADPLDQRKGGTILMVVANRRRVWKRVNLSAGIGESPACPIPPDQTCFYSPA